MKIKTSVEKTKKNGTWREHNMHIKFLNGQRVEFLCIAFLLMGKYNRT